MKNKEFTKCKYCSTLYISCGTFQGGICLDGTCSLLNKKVKGDDDCEIRNKSKHELKKMIHEFKDENIRMEAGSEWCGILLKEEIQSLLMSPKLRKEWISKLKLDINENLTDNYKNLVTGYIDNGKTFCTI